MFIKQQDYFRNFFYLPPIIFAAIIPRLFRLDTNLKYCNKPYYYPIFSQAALSSHHSREYKKNGPEQE